MQFSESWLRTFCNPPMNTEALCHLLTMAGLEVEAVAPVAADFSNVVIAQVVSVEAHPNADKLRVCRVDTGGGESLQIVCGAPNVAAGMKAPCALPGAILPGIEIKAAKLRGVESHGMLCSGQELGIDQSHDGLMVLPTDAPIGTSLREFLALDDRLITIKLTPNRADCLSLLGIARELSALSGSPLILPPREPVKATHGRKRAIALDAPQACPFYCGRIIDKVNAGVRSPEWMQRYLVRSGLRPISAIVDITNFVMLELGQPLHAFDNDKLNGTIHVRFAHAGDELELLNGQTLVPSADLLLIADEQKPVGLGGIMGGEQSSVTDQTCSVFLEGAFFQADAIAGRARALGFSSDASHRFERGVAFDLPIVAIERATALIVAICGGEPGPIAQAREDAWVPRREAVSVRPERVRKVLGVAIDDETMQGIFERLAFQMENSSLASTTWQITAPSYRFDIHIEEDLIEEVARVYGYDNIPAELPVGAPAILPLPEDKRAQSLLRHLIAARDYQEVVNFAFVDERWETELLGNVRPIRLANPIANQLAVMRSSLLGGLIATLTNNLNRRAARVRIFEIGRIFEKNADNSETGGYAQPLRLSMLIWGPAAPEQWGTESRRADFYDLKGDVEALLQTEFRCVPHAHPALHPGRAARIEIEGRSIGILGELHPRWVQEYDLGTAPIVAELDLDIVQAQLLPAHKEFSKYPLVVRDLALVVPQTLAAAQIIDTLAEHAPEIVRSIEVFDVYQGKGVDPEYRSIAFRITMQDTDRTLEDAEVESARRTLIQAAQEHLDAKLRA